MSAYVFMLPDPWTGFACSLLDILVRVHTGLAHPFALSYHPVPKGVSWGLSLMRQVKVMSGSMKEKVGGTVVKEMLWER